MLAAIQRYLPQEIIFTPPPGGLFIWLGLSPGIDAEKLLPLACVQGVAFYPGTNFFPNPVEGRGYIRLNFASLLPEEIEEGVRRLGTAFQILKR